MVASIKFSEETRDRTHNLDLDDENHLEIYENELYSYIKENELINGKMDLKIYHDSVGKRTIGIGFNMDDPSAKTFWKDAFGDSLSFDDARLKKIPITEEQARQLFAHVVNTNKTYL